jgi:hypothetical protein
MNSIQDRDTVLSVLRGQNEQWHVTTPKASKPLASFNNPQAACAWAIDRSKPMGSKIFVDEILLAWERAGDLRPSKTRG